MRAGCFAETRVIDLLNRRFVPFFFNRGGPGQGHDEEALKFTVGKTKNKWAYLAAFTPDGKILGETEIYADKNAVFSWLRKLLAEHPEYAAPTPEEAKLLKLPVDQSTLARALLLEELGDYDAAIRAHRALENRAPENRALEKRKEHLIDSHLAYLRIARYRRDWKRHQSLESALHCLDKGGTRLVDSTMERGHRLLAQKNYSEARAQLQALAKQAATARSPRLAEVHFYAGIACWFADDRDWAKFHWCWVLDNLPDDRLYSRARVAAAAEIMPYPNLELGEFTAEGNIGPHHIVREVAQSMRVYRRLLPTWTKAAPKPKRTPGK